MTAIDRADNSSDNGDPGPELDIDQIESLIDEKIEEKTQQEDGSEPEVGRRKTMKGFAGGILGLGALNRLRDTGDTVKRNSISDTGLNDFSVGEVVTQQFDVEKLVHSPAFKDANVHDRELISTENVEIYVDPGSGSDSSGDVRWLSG
ncbi:MAG: hypothetical protein ABEK59_05660 [Halobacteria archaeon]